MLNLYKKQLSSLDIRRLTCRKRCDRIIRWRFQDRQTWTRKLTLQHNCRPETIADLICRGRPPLSPAPLLRDNDRAQEYGGHEDVIGAKCDYMRLVHPIDR